jgi:hypothetical protein
MRVIKQSVIIIKAGRSHDINDENISLRGWNNSHVWSNLNLSKFYSPKN